MPVPEEHHWVFWDVDPSEIDLEGDSTYVIARVLEKGRMAEVRWLMRTYGLSSIHRVLATAANPELSPRTLAMWRVVLDAKDEPWANPPAWRQRSSIPWPS
ncbi:MAG: hypothetical protein MJD61_22505 [Proteobacteria bacterium]|nr:hypothetical protein [Pseudomonadota bacterium]